MKEKNWVLGAFEMKNGGRYRTFTVQYSDCLVGKNGYLYLGNNHPQRILSRTMSEVTAH
jgi:hypothetical protein